jgi:Putative zinc-finger
MTNLYTCDDKERLVAYLYGETSDRERALLDAHLAECGRCADEIEGLRAVRVDLAAWQPPEADLGFRIVREPVAVTRRWWQVPVWVPTAMAAGLLLAFGAAAANIHLEYGPGTIALRMGSAPTSAVAQARPQTVTPTAVPAPASGAAAQQFKDALAALEVKLRSEMASLRTAAASNVSTRTQAGTMDRAELLQRVQELIDASERRQQRELALRLAQVVQDVDTQRRSDMVRIENGFGQIEGLTGQEAERQRRLINYLMRASQQR